jgi:uncharacterized protein (DUF433 family)
MIALRLTSLAPGLRVDEGGVVRVGATRVTVDTLVGSYRDGSTAEEIVQQYPSLALADVHAAIAYYLTHQAEVNAYLLERQNAAAETRQRAEKAGPQHGMRERLLARQVLRVFASLWLSPFNPKTPS